MPHTGSFSMVVSPWTTHRPIEDLAAGQVLRAGGRTTGLDTLRARSLLEPDHEPHQQHREERDAQMAQ
jgi:hypothetical protein